MPRHRTQLLLDPDQYQAVAQLAQLQHRSISEIVREFVAWGLERLQRDREQRLKALEDLDAMRQELEARVGAYPGDPVAEARAERERQMDGVISSREAK